MQIRLRTFGGEKWDGYPLDRQQILDFLAARRLVNTVVLTGDVHVNFVRNVPPDYIRLDAEPVATEFIGTSVSTGGDRTLVTTYGGDANNPHLCLQRQPSRVRSLHFDSPALAGRLPRCSSVLVQDAPISTLASFVVQQGRAGALLA